MKKIIISILFICVSILADINYYNEKIQTVGTLETGKIFKVVLSDVNGTLDTSLTGTQRQLFVKRLDTIGDGNGTYNMAVNGSITPVIYRVKPPIGEVWRVATWALYVQDTGVFDAIKWGNNITMTTGLDLVVLKDGVSSDLLTFPIKNSGDVSALAEGFNYLTMGTGDTILTAYWSFIKSGQYLRLNGSTGDELQVIVNDDITGLSLQYIQVSGYKE